MPAAGSMFSPVSLHWTTPGGTAHFHCHPVVFSKRGANLATLQPAAAALLQLQAQRQIPPCCWPPAGSTAAACNGASSDHMVTWVGSSLAGFRPSCRNAAVCHLTQPWMAVSLGFHGRQLAYPSQQGLCLSQAFEQGHTMCQWGTMPMLCASTTDPAACLSARHPQGCPAGGESQRESLHLSTVALFCARNPMAKPRQARKTAQCFGVPRRLGF